MTGFADQLDEKHLKVCRFYIAFCLPNNHKHAHYFCLDWLDGNSAPGVVCFI